ncbi:MAG: 50S ribosome-binding GTPase [Candidatus Lokiarchaeota archaeon]|nr:50S ribosome-binding GTPase [Candidatus Lokiarchaeota archaeon]
MVLYKDGKIYLKIVYWGMGASGKTTILKTLFRITKESKKEIIPIGELQIIEKDSGATLYFDRGLFQSTKQKEVYYRVYTVAGQKGFTPLRKKIFDKTNDQTDAVIFVVDSRTNFLEDNIESLLELRNIANDRLINEIPMIVMLNKQDLDDVIDEEDFKLILKDEKLWYEPGNKLYNWNPLIYTSCAIYEKEKDIYRSFHECARRSVLYHVYGEGKAPLESDISKTQ